MSSFFSPYRHQFVRVGACVPLVAVAEPEKNGDQALALMRNGDAGSVANSLRAPRWATNTFSIRDPPLLLPDCPLR